MMEAKQVVGINFKIETILTKYKKEVENELAEILNYWMRHTKDSHNSGFVGRIDENNIVHPEAAKGAVLNSRILWAFSASYSTTLHPDHLLLANISFRYIADHFVDKINGGGLYHQPALLP